MFDQSLDATCRLCGDTYTSRGITRHVSACLSKHRGQLTPNGNAERSVSTYHLRVRGYGLASSDYRLNLCASAEATLADLDQVFRDIWLECCGHLSAFTLDDVRYSVSPSDGFGFGPPERNMDHPLHRVLDADTEGYYEYDFGTTSELELSVISELDLQPKQPIQLLARNEPPELTCAGCDAADATQICTECLWDDDQAPWLCESCSEDHSHDEWAQLPVVNSSRMGLCGYTGPSVEP